MRPRLEVVLITKNAAHLLPATLRAVSWADAILVVDSGSTDGTVGVAEGHGAKVISQPDWRGYGYQKSFALSHADADWILVLDADEVVDDRLGEAIRSAVRREAGDDRGPAGYALLRVNYFRGERVRFGHSRPSYVERLFRKEKGSISDHRVHERVLIDGRVEKLPGELHHYTTESISHRVRKNDEYATVAAEEWFREGRRSSLLRLIFIMPLSVLRDLVLKGGILDGKKGVILAGLGAFYSFSKYAKLEEKDLANPKREDVI